LCTEADLETPEKLSIVWTDYMKYRADLREFNLTKIENILRYSEERYFDTATRRLIAVGRHAERLVLIPYEKKENEIIPITIHTTTQQQINFRLKTGRFKHE
jgi:hypothetical protein